ncbi:MAG: hypothetical protein PHF74_07440 [Dehalococcoidales bacterium]|nr:hypothetical protein [Dehalococcoidales bacterium]
MTKYYLSKRTIGSPGRIDLDESEYNKILQARNNLFIALSIEENFDLLLANYLSFETYLLQITAEQVIGRHLDYTTAQSHRRQLNRLLMNLLSSCKAYADQTKHYISEIFSNKSQIYEDITNEFLSKHKQYAGYRIMEALRNNAQHSGWLIHAFSMPCRIIEEGGKNKIQFNCLPRLLITYIDCDSRFNKKILEEIKQIGEDIDIRPLIRQYIQGLIEVNKKIRKVLSPHIIKWENTVQCAIKRFQENNPEETTLSLSLFIENDNCKKYVDIFDEFIGYRQQLINENSGVANLPLSYISNNIDIKT